MNCFRVLFGCSVFFIHMLHAQFLVFRVVNGQRVVPTADEYQRVHEILIRYQFPMYVGDDRVAASEKDTLDENETAFLQLKIRQVIAPDLQIEKVPPTLYALALLYLDLNACAAREVLVLLLDSIDRIKADCARQLLDLPFFTVQQRHEFQQIMATQSGEHLRAWRQTFEEAYADLLDARARYRSTLVSDPAGVHIMNWNVPLDYLTNLFLINNHYAVESIIEACSRALRMGRSFLQSCLFAERLDANVIFEPAELMQTIELERRWSADTWLYFYAPDALNEVLPSTLELAREQERFKAFARRGCALRLDRHHYRYICEVNGCPKIIQSLTVTADVLAGVGDFQRSFLAANMLTARAQRIIRADSHAHLYGMPSNAYAAAYQRLCTGSTLAMRAKLQDEYRRLMILVTLYPGTLHERGVSTEIRQLYESSVESMRLAQVPYIFYAQEPFSDARAIYVGLRQFGIEFIASVLCPILPRELVEKFRQRGVIIVNRNFDNLLYARRRFSILHELAHALQDQSGCYGRAMRPDLYPRGTEQEADTLALINCHCRQCAEEVAARTCEEPIAHGYLTRAEMLEYARAIPSDELCDYHTRVGEARHS